MSRNYCFFATLLDIATYAKQPGHKGCASPASCCQYDSINMPVYIVDGVEVQDLSGIDSEDIVKVDIIKDPQSLKFSAHDWVA